MTSSSATTATWAARRTLLRPGARTCGRCARARRLVPAAAGRATAAAVPDAELLEIEGMGHDLPRACWERILDRLDDVTRRAEAARR